MSRPAPHPPELWARCRDAVVTEGLTLAAAAARVGIPVSTVEKRSRKEEWGRLRREAREGALSYRGRIMRLKSRLLDQALESGDVQQVQAWQGVERAYPDKVYAGITDPQKRQLVGVFVNALVEYLQEEAPSLLPPLGDHLEGLARHALKADWEASA